VTIQALLEQYKTTQQPTKKRYLEAPELSRDRRFFQSFKAPFFSGIVFAFQRAQVQ
jgi:hypothetical protein